MPQLLSHGFGTQAIRPIPLSLTVTSNMSFAIEGEQNGAQTGKLATSGKLVGPDNVSCGSARSGVAGTCSSPGETDAHAISRRQVQVQVILAELVGHSSSEVEAGLEQIVFTGRKPGRLILTPNSGAVDVLVRALQIQGRIDILSRTHHKVLDGEPTVIRIGDDIDSIIAGKWKGVPVVTGPGPYPEDRDRLMVGGTARVTPKITAEGEVECFVSTLSTAVRPPHSSDASYKTVSVECTDARLTAGDGETVILGGKVEERTKCSENQVPLIGSLPLLGNMFRYETRTKQWVQRLLIVTPSLVSADDE